MLEGEEEDSACQLPCSLRSPQTGSKISINRAPSHLPQVLPKLFHLASAGLFKGMNSAIIRQLTFKVPGSTSCWLYKLPEFSTLPDFQGRVLWGSVFPCGIPGVSPLYIAAPFLLQTALYHQFLLFLTSLMWLFLYMWLWIFFCYSLDHSLVYYWDVSDV